MSAFSPQSKVAVIGAGAAGLTAAYLLKGKCHVTLFEESQRAGGHAHTFELPNGPDEGTPLDLGFMVLNNKNYPTMHRLLECLGVDEIKNSEMSFSYWKPSDTFHYALNFDSANTFTQFFTKEFQQNESQKNVSRILKMVLRFMEYLKRDFERGILDNLTFGEYLDQRHDSSRLIQSYIIPMAAAIWSSPPELIRKHPAKSIASFYLNHGLLDLENKIQWQFIKGGSQRYVSKILETLNDSVRYQKSIFKVFRKDDRVTIYFSDNESEKFDYIVFATHSNITLELLGDATEAESTHLSAWDYYQNRCILHCDEAAMPPRESWASWNYINGANPDEFCMVYHLNRLQAHTRTIKQYFLNVNTAMPIKDEHIILETKMSHPSYSKKSTKATAWLQKNNGINRTYFCGSYLGSGFHEDAIKTAAVAIGKLVDDPLIL